MFACKDIAAYISRGKAYYLMGWGLHARRLRPSTHSNSSAQVYCFLPAAVATAELEDCWAAEADTDIAARPEPRLGLAVSPCRTSRAADGRPERMNAELHGANRTAMA